MPKITQLHDYHKNHAKLTEFAGFEMPLWYTTTSDEHMAVRLRSGIFDVSHMGRFQVSGAAAGQFLEELVPTKVQQQPVGRAFYTLLLNEGAGIIDDLIIVRTSDTDYLVVVNAANAETDMKHLVAHKGEGVNIDDITGSSVMIALQGPEAQSVLQPLTDTDLSQLKRFRSIVAPVMGNQTLVSRTGYTGEDGFELVVYGPTVDSPESGLKVWERLAEGATPCGLGARDSLRLEAGLPLHGSDIDPETDPFTADLAWVITEGKEGYVGSKALDEIRRNGTQKIRRGVTLQRGIPRHGFEVFDASGDMIGSVTSGTYSPLLKKGIALSRVRKAGTDAGISVQVMVRETKEQGNVEKTPFYDQSMYGWKRTAQH